MLSGARSVPQENTLLNVTLTPEAKAKLLALLAKEDPDEVFCRILEVKIGSG